MVMSDVAPSANTNRQTYAYAGPDKGRIITATSCRGTADALRSGQHRSEVSPVNALALLKEDHDKAKKLMEDLATTTERGVKTRQEKWTKLLKELTIHENIEEEIFYPALHENDKLKDIVLEALEEHHLVDDIVEQLKGTAFEDEHWSAKFKVTKENVEHHIDEEEGPMFKAVRQNFTADQLEELGSRMEQRKLEQMEEPMPERDQVEL
jgi:hypothetical protein